MLKVWVFDKIIELIDLMILEGVDMFGKVWFLVVKVKILDVFDLLMLCVVVVCVYGDMVGDVVVVFGGLYGDLDDGLILVVVVVMVFLSGWVLFGIKFVDMVEVVVVGVDEIDMVIDCGVFLFGCYGFVFD